MTHGSDSSFESARTQPTRILQSIDRFLSTRPLWPWPRSAIYCHSPNSLKHKCVEPHNKPKQTLGHCLGHCILEQHLTHVRACYTVTEGIHSMSAVTTAIMTCQEMATFLLGVAFAETQSTDKRVPASLGMWACPSILLCCSSGPSSVPPSPVV